MLWLLAAIAVLAAALLVLVVITPFIDRYRQRILRRCFRDVCDLLNMQQVDYWCDFGTLLGCYRENDIILRDYDVDLCMMVDERPKVSLLGDAFRARGYTFRDANDTTHRVIRIFDNRSRYYVDLYHYTLDGEWARSPYRSEEDVPARLVANRTVGTFIGGPVRVPADIPSLLLYRYGPDYMTPRRGDRGVAYGFSRIESFLRILENNMVGLWSICLSFSGRA